jgi:integrase
VTDKLAKVSPGSLSTAKLVDRAREHASAAVSENTRKAYARQWRDFKDWCAAKGVEPMPARPEVVVLYVTMLSERPMKVASIAQAVAAISKAHELRNFPSPRENSAVRMVLKGIRRSLGTHQHQARPIVAEQMRRLLGALGDRLIDKRDAALLLLGIYSGCRGSELVAVDMADVQPVRGGLEILIRRSKTDQEARGRKVAIPASADTHVCACTALRVWVKAAGITQGPVFREVNRHGQAAATRLGVGAVAEIVKRTCAKAGVDPKGFSAHSLRAGFITQAIQSGKSERKIMEQTGHKSITVMREYIRDADLWRDNAAAGLLDE